ncbi:MAG: hypothetical protein HY078_02780 [Elusimicrobia bacterium]|nr:hypothetical protein [Elusimicrobiota bacterium]
MRTSFGPHHVARLAAACIAAILSMAAPAGAAERDPLSEYYRPIYEKLNVEPRHRSTIVTARVMEKAIGGLSCSETNHAPRYAERDYLCSLTEVHDGRVIWARLDSVQPRLDVINGKPVKVKKVSGLSCFETAVPGGHAYSCVLDEPEITD